MPAESKLPPESTTWPWKPACIGIDTIYLSHGSIPEAFPRGAGVPEPFIVQMKALVAAMEPIQFYSCFISYSTKDQEFAKRLHGDLQKNHVRCWFAPENLRIGEKYVANVTWESKRAERRYILVRRCGHDRELFAAGLEHGLTYFEEHAKEDPEFMFLLNSLKREKRLAKLKLQLSERN